MNVVKQALTEARSLIADMDKDYPPEAAMTHACCEVVIARIDAAICSPKEDA